MPRFNPQGQVTPQLGYAWYDATRFVLQDCSSGVCKIVLSDGTVLIARGCNSLAANGAGVFAAWLGGLGVFDGDGRIFPDSDIAMQDGGAGAMSPEGGYAIKVARNSFGPWEVLERDGTRWPLTPGDARDISLFSGRRALWNEGGFLKSNFAIPNAPTEPLYWPRGAFAGDRCLVLYQRQSDGALILDRKQIAPPSSNYFFPDVCVVAGQVRVTWSASEADTNAQFLSFTLAALDALPSAAAATVPVPPALPTPSSPPPVSSVHPAPTPAPSPEPVHVPETPFVASAVTFLDNPSDLASWPQTATITRVDQSRGKNVVDFDKRTGPGAWPNAPFGDGSDGTCQYTLGLCLQIRGKWYGSAVIEFWQGRELEAGGDVGAIAKDWYYDSNRWGDLAGHQPAPGELVAWFVAAGNLRDNERIGVRERSDFVVLPFGQNYQFEPAAAPAPPAPPVIPVAPPPPVQTSAPPPVAADATPLLEMIAALDARVSALEHAPAPAAVAGAPDPTVAHKGDAITVNVFGSHLKGSIDK